MSRMKLGLVSRGRVARSMRVVMYGVEGIGKSTFAAHAPSTIFLGAEDGTAHLDVARFPQPQTWQDVLDAVEELRTGEHDFKTLAIDTLDALEPLCWAHVCQREKVKSIESIGYGKGYVLALDEWRALLARLDVLRDARGMHVILLAHSALRLFKNPEGDDFDRWELKLHKGASALAKEWCDALLFATWEQFAVAKDQRVRGVSTGARVIHLERTAAFDAKNRYGLSGTLPLSWDKFATAATGVKPSVELRTQIIEAALELDEAARAKVGEAVRKAGDDAQKLAELLNRVKARAAQAQKEVA